MRVRRTSLRGNGLPAVPTGTGRAQGDGPPVRVAVVTGAARGIGRAVASRLATDGYRLVLGDVNGAQLRRTARELHCRPTAFAVDVSRPGAARELAEAARSRFGRLDVWINNAAVVPIGRLDQQTPDLLAHTCDVNLRGVVHGCHAAAQSMLPQGHGHIVNVASVLATKPLPGFAVYSATKAGVLALSEALRRELHSHHIHVTAVLPYMVNTPAAVGLRPCLLPALRPEQVADAVCRTLRRPRARVFIPRLARLLTYASLLPQRAQDAADALLGTDDIAAASDTAARAAYDAELRKQITTP